MMHTAFILAGLGLLALIGYVIYKTVAGGSTPSVVVAQNQYGGP